MFCYQFDSKVYYQLQKEWPSLIYNNRQKEEDNTFWTQQWRKHGTCSSIKLEDYFKLTLDIHKRTILKDVLQKKSIKPDEKNSLPRENIFDAIKEAIEGKNPEILCVEYKNKSYVKEIRMCLDKTKDHKYMDCPRKYVNCPTNVYFPWNLYIKIYNK